MIRFIVLFVDFFLVFSLFWRVFIVFLWVLFIVDILVLYRCTMIELFFVSFFMYFFNRVIFIRISFIFIFCWILRFCRVLFCCSSCSYLLWMFSFIVVWLLYRLLLDFVNFEFWFLEFGDFGLIGKWVLSFFFVLDIIIFLFFLRLFVIFFFLIGVIGLFLVIGDILLSDNCCKVRSFLNLDVGIFELNSFLLI